MCSAINRPWHIAGKRKLWISKWVHPHKGPPQRAQRSCMSKGPRGLRACRSKGPRGLRAQRAFWSKGPRAQPKGPKGCVSNGPGVVRAPEGFIAVDPFGIPSATLHRHCVCARKRQCLCGTETASRWHRREKLSVPHRRCSTATASQWYRDNLSAPRRHFHSFPAAPKTKTLWQRDTLSMPWRHCVCRATVTDHASVKNTGKHQNCIK